MWEYLLGYLGGTVGLLAVLGFLTRSILKHFLSKDIEKFKIQLKSDADRAQQELENNLKLIATEHQVRYTKLHDKRAEVLASLYSHLSKAVKETRSCVSIIQWEGEPSKVEKYKIALQKILDFNWYFDEHRIYLTESLCQLIDSFIDKLYEPTAGLSYYLEDVTSYGSEAVREKSKVWRDAWKSIESNIPPARKALEDEFRKILGVEVVVDS